MTTAAQVVNDAAYACGALGQGETLSNDDSALILRRLNRMLDAWGNLRNLLYDVDFDTFTCTPGTQSYSSTLLLNVGRPLGVDAMYARLNNVDYPIALISDDEWARIPYKIPQAIPSMCWLDTSYPNSTFNLYPIPDQAYVIYVGATKPLTQLSLTSTIAFPPGYEKALVDCLTVDIAESFGKQVTPVMDRAAMVARKQLANKNFQTALLDSEVASRYRYSRADFLRGV